MTSTPGTLQAVCCGNDDEPQQEPTVVTNFWNNFYLGPISAFMSFRIPCCNNGAYVKTSNNGTIFDAPAALSTQGDPSLAVNFYDFSAMEGNLGRNRVYLARTDQSSNNETNRIITSYTDYDGAANWSSPVIVHENFVPPDNTPAYQDDRPSIAVSWYSGGGPLGYGSTLGYAYLAFDRGALQSGLNNEILVYRSTDGGQSWGTPTALIKSPDIPSAHPTFVQLVVDNHAGNIYLLFLDYDALGGNGGIYIMKSDPSATAFTLLNGGQPLDGGQLLHFPSDLLPGDGRSFSLQIAATSFVIARYNHLAHKIGVVWQAREANGLNADVHFAAFDTDQNIWWSPRTVNPVANDGVGQWNPALDFDPSGNWLVSYYNAVPETTQYTTRVRKLLSFGDPIDGGDLSLAGFNADASRAVVHPPRGDNGLGEYQDIWYSNGQWIAVTVYTSPSTTKPSDIYYGFATP